MKEIIHKHHFLLKSLRTYIILLVVVIVSSTPLYVQTFNISKKSVLDNTEHNIRLGLRMLENEINMHESIIQKLIVSPEYKFVKNSTNVLFPDEYLYLKTLKNFYNGLCVSLNIQEDSFIMFDNNDIILSKKSIFHDGKISYGTIWRFCNYTYNQIKEKFLTRKYYGEFLKSYCFQDIVSNKYSDLVYVSTISSDLNNVPSAVLFTIYDGKKIMELCGLSEIAEIGIISIKNANDDELFVINNYTNNSIKPDLTCLSENSKLKISVTIPKSYYNSKINTVIKTIFIYIIISIIIGIIISIMLAYKQGKPIQKIISNLSMISGRKYKYDNEYDYIENVINELDYKNIQTNEILLDKLFVKLVLTGLNSKELEILYKMEGELFFSYYLFLLRNRKNTGNWSSILLSELAEKKTNIYRCVVINKSDVVLFIKEEHMDLNGIKQIILKLNKEKGWDIRGVINSPTNKITGATDAYKRLKKAIQYIEYGNLIIIEDINTSNAVDNEIITNVLKNRQLYEIIRSCNEFEAKRLIYEQWYNISQKPAVTNEIERLFYMQTGVILQLSNDLDCKIDIPTFDDEADIVTLAFSITKCVDQICEFIKRSKKDKKEDKRTLQILEYINEHIYRSSFYMLELVEKFSMSDRTITQLIKNMTGKTFSDYVTHLRIKKAEELIRNSELPIKEVAIRSGFDSSNSLYKSFKKIYGVSPSTYRNNRS